MTPTTRFAVLSVLAALAALSAPGTLAAQTDARAVRVTVPQENFRKEPQASSNNRLATLLEGAVLGVDERRGRWVRATLEGWMWAPSLQTTDRDGFDLVVSKSGGENLRREPAGESPRVAVLMQGMLLDRVETRGSWMRVRRSAWVWSASTAETTGGPATVTLPAPVGDDRPDTATADVPESLPDRLVVGAERAGLLISPEGDTVAVVASGADLQVIAREGGWTRVRLEGWVWEPATLTPDSAAGAAFDVADLRANPEQFQGRRVEWSLRFVSLQRAEPIRTDFYEGEPYFLANPPGRSRDLVYVAVPPELLPVVEQLEALQTVDVVARVRTGRSQTGVPILDLVALR